MSVRTFPHTQSVLSCSLMSARTALCIGTFDAVHRGHQALIRAARQQVGPAPQGRVTTMSFDPHPLAILRPEKTPARLTTFDQRSEYLKDAGADEVVRIMPSREFLAQTPEQFLAKITEKHKPAVIVEGADFRFGKARAGSIDTLRELGKKFQFTVEVVEPVTCELTDQSIVTASSSLLRWMLAHGRVRDAEKLCDRRYEIWGAVVQGDKRGRELGFPTANIQPTGEVMLPADGIYAGTALRPDGSTWPAAISIGTKPTFGENPRTCEAHLIGYDGPLDDYGWPIRLRFHDWLRDQLRYESVDELIAQLSRDCAHAEEATEFIPLKQC